MRYALLILLVAASLSATSSPRAFGHTWVRWIALVPAAEAGGAGFAGEASEEAGAVSRFSREGGRCFVAGTLVWMADGTTKPVEEVKSGDWVLSRDPVTGKVSASQVGPCTERQAGSVEAVTLTDSQSGQSQTLVCSPEHPFYVDGKGFVAAASLGVGTSIVTRAGPSLTVTGVAEETQPGGYAVYNFVVPGDHTYFVGNLDGGAWVHNPAECDGLIGGNGGRGGGAAHASVQNDLLNKAGGESEVWFAQARRAADVVDAQGRIHQIGNLRTRGGFRPSSRERAAIEDIRKEVGPGRTIIFHDKLGKGPSLINPDLQSNWKPAPRGLRKNP